jgi:hypothetical protein
MRLSLQTLLPGADRGWKSMYAVCGLRSCENTLLMRSVQSRVGISIGETWYCSMNCFAAVARTRLLALSGAGGPEVPHIPRRSIGLTMLSKGYLTAEQLRFAMAQSQASGEDLEAVLLQLGLANERQLTVARAVQWGYPVFGQDRTGQPMEADIPPILLHSCSAVPLHLSMAAKRFVLGFVYRVEHSLMNSLEQMTGFRTEPCFITPTEFAEQRPRVKPSPECEEVVFETPETPAQMAKTVAGFALEVSAREASFTRCREFLWVRLSGKRRKVDVLFRAGHERMRGRPELPCRGVPG